MVPHYDSHYDSQLGTLSWGLSAWAEVAIEEGLRSSWLACTRLKMILVVSREMSANMGDDAVAQAREADKWIGQRLREINYDLSHPEAQLLANRLQSLGIGTLINMKKSNTLFQACMKLGLYGLPRPPESWNDESQRLIVVAVKVVIPRFITHNMRKWDSQKSTIGTYFVNCCLFEFKKLYLEYYVEESQGLAERPTENVIEMFKMRATEDSSENLAITRQTIREITKLMGSQQFADLILLKAQDLTRAEIAEKLGISVRTLDRRIKEYRQKLENGGWSSREEGE